MILDRRMTRLAVLCVSALMCLIIFLAFAPQAQAANLSDQITGQISAGAQAAEIGEAIPPQVIAAGIIRSLLTLVGTFMLGLVIYGGYLIFTAEGDDQKVEKGRKTLRGAVIGLLIVMASYSITLFVGKTVEYTTQGELNREVNVEVKCSLFGCKANPLQ
jgi:hypothetical protein